MTTKPLLLNDDGEIQSTKIISIIPEKTPTTKRRLLGDSSTVQMEKPKVKRVVTKKEQWQHVIRQQDEKLPEWLLPPEADTAPKSGLSDARLVHQQIQSKRSGYRSQDQLKHLYDPEKFVTFADILSLLNQSTLICYYCKDAVLVLYDYVRDMRQWTLERLDNHYGHNRDNVVLACLKCNLRRRTMHSERYVKTQEMKHVVKLGHTAEPS
jgi:hypothetical protein